MKDFKHLGVISVDSGQLVITDPCYIESENEINGPHLLIPTGGDGLYDVFARYEHGALMQVKVIRVTRDE